MKRIYKKLGVNIISGTNYKEDDDMDAQRAQEIATSPVMEKVTYNGLQVYIQHVDENNGTARIYALKDPQKEQEVPISSLIEH